MTIVLLSIQSLSDIPKDVNAEVKKCVSVVIIVLETISCITSVVYLEYMVLRMLQAWLIMACTPFSTEVSRVAA